MLRTSGTWPRTKALYCYPVPVADISNADVAWFVVRFQQEGSAVRVARGEVYFTELEAAVSGLIAGRPVTRQVFEERILGRSHNLGAGPNEIVPDE